MKKVILFLGLALSLGLASCSKDETAMPDSGASDTKTKSTELESLPLPVVGETIEVMVEDEESGFEMVPPVVGDEIDIIIVDDRDPEVDGGPVRVRVICSRRTILDENGDFVGIGVDASGQEWIVTWNHSLQPNGIQTLTITGHKLNPGDHRPC